MRDYVANENRGLGRCDAAVDVHGLALYPVRGWGAEVGDEAGYFFGGA